MSSLTAFFYLSVLMKRLIPPLLSRLGLVVFDLAGTTFRVGDYVTGAFHQAFSESGIILNDGEISAIRGRWKRDAIAVLLQRHIGSKAASIRESVYQSFQNLLEQAILEQGVEAIPGAEEIFGWLQDRNVLIALNTGFDRHIVSLILDSVGWSEIADAVVCGDDVDRGRPAPDLILKAMEQTGCTEASRVLAVGDTCYDLQAAHNADVLAIGVLSGASDAEQLRACPHYAIIPSVANLQEVLGRKTPD